MTQRLGRSIAGALVAALALAACSSTITVEDWTVSCIDAPQDACAAVASVALNNMGRGRPREPTGIIRVVGRIGCAPVPEWADGTVCFDAHVPLTPNEEVCLVIAGRPELGVYGQVGGDEVSGLFNLGRTPDLVCR